jgi:tetratricopeptide (TPR) repeat protein
MPVLMNVPYLMKRLLLAVLCLVIHIVSLAQTDELSQARQFTTEKNYEKALPLFKKIYNTNPSDQSVYNDYFTTLLAANKNKDAEKIANEQLILRPQNPLSYIDLAKVYIANGNQKKANEALTESIDFINGDDIRTQLVVNALTAIDKDTFVILTYEKAKMMFGNPAYGSYLYGLPLSKLYFKHNEPEKAIMVLMEGMVYMPTGIENVKAVLLDILGTDQQKLQACSKAIIKRINIQPDNIQYIELLTWLYTQRGDWDGAYLQMQAIDERNKETGNHLVSFAQMAAKEKQWDAAIKAYDAVILKGKTLPFYTLARQEKLLCMQQQIMQDPEFKKVDVNNLCLLMDSTLLELPNLYAQPFIQQYALLQALYAENPKRAIELLEKAIASSGQRPFIGECKLQMADYYVLLNKVWDASLLYGQVDKDFKEDALGEDARFRRAKLAYYRGDFEWAQGQLTVLKASTSELIANDALYLSVLITENTAKDSNTTPLLRFAHADLLLFQNKDKEAEILLDTLAANYPKHPLNDDILLLRAKIAEKHKEYLKALDYLKVIYEKYGKDVLADDAVFKSAEIYEKYLHLPQTAAKLYEQLIVDYPGSTYVQTARQRLYILQGNHAGS